MADGGNKLRMLCVLDILRKYSDEDHPLSSLKISDLLLEKYGIKCDRKATIYDDINSLQLFNDNCFNIEVVSSPKKGFCIYEREFQLTELYLLCDAVQAAQFVTKKNTKELVSKLESFASVYQSSDIGSMVYIDNRRKSDNSQIYYNIFFIHQAISEKKKIEVKYKRHQVDKNRERHFTVSPYAMIWSNDCYYLICNNDTKENLMHMRLDRISKVEILDEQARPFEKYTNYKGKFDSADYASKMFSAFAGKEEVIELICDKCIYQELIDRFGAKYVKNLKDSEFVYVSFKGALSGGLVNWIMQYGDKIYIKSPSNLQSMFNNKLQQIKDFQAKRDKKLKEL